ncbi:hypothetical protein [Hymenobacter norwichensis]|uniref:hypothetical protein n=1 Tax=Hymenobacter norwichensis TaxID=223903 RepID=UPI00146CAE9E|nr:hypothetical protein [Hymenobacter norwichensis]
MKNNDTPQTFSQLIRERDQFTDRDFMKVMGVGFGVLKRKEADPSLLTVAEMMGVAKMIKRPVEQVIKIVLAEVSRNKEVIEQLNQIPEQVIGRKYSPRKPKAQE